jgi:hypothetical protein
MTHADGVTIRDNDMCRKCDRTFALHNYAHVTSPSSVQHLPPVLGNRSLAIDSDMCRKYDRMFAPHDYAHATSPNSVQHSSCDLLFKTGYW